MILRIGDEEQTHYHVHFHREYAESDEARRAKGLQPLLWDVITTCSVHTGSCVLSAGQQKYCIVGHVGTSKCSKRDQFVKATGAKTALARALRHLGPDVRKKIWDAYWLQTRRPKERSEKFRNRVARTKALLEKATPMGPGALRERPTRSEGARPSA